VADIVAAGDIAHRLTSRGRGVESPRASGVRSISVCGKACFPAGDRRERVQQVAGGSCQPIKSRHHQHVAGDVLVEQAAKLRPVGLGPLATSRNTLSASCYRSAAT